MLSQIQERRRGGERAEGEQEMERKEIKRRRKGEERGKEKG